ncbi:hypothetical protein ACQY0O_002154 [Thecaphora frezii]
MSCLPYISLQPNYPEVFTDISSSTVSTEKVWLSVYSANAPSGSIHAKLDLHAAPTPSSSTTTTATTATVAEQQRKEKAEVQGGVKVASISGGEGDQLAVERVAGSALDLLVSAGSAPSPTSGQESFDVQCSARALRPSISLPPTYVRLPKRSVERVLPASKAGHINQNFTAYPNIEAFDVSPTDNGLYVAGGEDGTLVVGSLLDSSDVLAVADTLEDEEKEALQGRHGEERRVEALASLRIKEKEQREKRDRRIHLKGHVGDIRSARFFPSGQVVLTTSSDLSTRIFSALDGSNPRTLTGHKRAVLCSGILGRGREILTGGGDGTVRLYDVGEGKQKTMFGVERFSSVNAMAVPLAGDGVSEIGETGNIAVANEFVVGLSSGHAEVMDIRAKRRAGIVGGYAFPPGKPPRASDSWTQEASTGQVLAVDWYRNGSHNVIVTGTAQGIVSVYDARMLGAAAEAASGGAPPKALLGSWKRNGSAVHALRLVDAAGGSGGVDVLVATADGLPYRANTDAILAGRGNEEAADPPEVEANDDAPTWYSRAARVVEEYAGWDCDPTAAITVDYRGRVVIAGSDARIKRY